MIPTTSSGLPRPSVTSGRDLPMRTGERSPSTNTSQIRPPKRNLIVDDGKWASAPTLPPRKRVKLRHKSSKSPRSAPPSSAHPHKLLSLHNGQLDASSDEISTATEEEDVEGDPDASLQSSRLSTRDLTVYKELGRGGFGRVGLCKVDGQSGLFAVKAMKAPASNDRFGCWVMLNELTAMRTASSLPYSVELYASFMEEDKAVMIMELCQRRSLEYRRHLDGLPSFGTAPFKLMLLEMTIGVDHLHVNGIVHHDLKLDNFLVGDDGHIRVADFGAATSGLDITNGLEDWGTLGYQSPEILDGDWATRDTDKFSLGVCYFILADNFHQEPFPPVDAADGTQESGPEWILYLENGVCPSPAIQNPDNDPDITLNASYFDEVISRLLEIHPKFRPSLNDVCKFEFFSDVFDLNSDALYSGLSPPPFEPLVVSHSIPAKARTSGKTFWEAFDEDDQVGDNSLEDEAYSDDEEDDAFVLALLGFGPDGEDPDSLSGWYRPLINRALQGNITVEAQQSKTPMGNATVEAAYFNVWENPSPAT